MKTATSCGVGLVVGVGRMLPEKFSQTPVSLMVAMLTGQLW